MSNPTVQIEPLDNIHWQNPAACTYALDGSNHIWRIQISHHISQIHQLSRLLSADEHERANRYYREHDKQRFIISRASLRLLLGRYLNLGPKQIAFQIGDNKKPHVKDHTGICYNVSHSGDYILIALSTSDVGVDVEIPDLNIEYRDIMHVSYSKPETDYVNQAADPIQAFYTLWTRKEALLKATAKGIDDGLKFIPSTNGLHHTMFNTIGSNKSWIVQSFRVDDTHLGCIASAISSNTFWDIDLIM